MTRHLIMTIALLISLYIAAPGLAATQTIDPNSGPWTAQINAYDAKVSITGQGTSYSTVHVKILYTDKDEKDTEKGFPVNLMYLKTANITPQKDGYFIKQITFECTRGKADIMAQPSSSSGVSGDAW